MLMIVEHVNLRHENQVRELALKRKRVCVVKLRKLSKAMRREKENGENGFDDYDYDTSVSKRNIQESEEKIHFS